LHEVTQAVLSTLDSKEVIQLIVDKVIDIMQVKASALRLRNEITHELELIATSGLSEKFLAKGQPHTNQSISATLAGKPVLITDTANDPRLEYPVETVAEGIASILSIPIVARQRVVGVLRLYSAEKRQYSQEEITFLSALAEIAGVAIMNARIYEKTRNDLSFWTATLGYMQD
jgi:GAF domain-containing protein